jgi:hypothetical protein
MYSETASAAMQALIRRTRLRVVRSGADVVQEVEVRVAESVCEQEAADKIVSARYAWRGYQCSSGADDCARADARSPKYFTLLASRGDKTVGTLTIGVDRGAGLLVEETARDIVDGLRSLGRCTMELIRLAVEDEVDSKAVLGELFFAAYAIGHIVHEATDALIEVNPRHVGFYEKVFGFVREASERVCTRVNAPAVLMRLDLAKLDQRLGMFSPDAAVEAKAA